jgi:hypothetical protein
MVRGIGGFFELLNLGLQVLQMLFLSLSESSLGRPILRLTFLVSISV